MVIPKPVSLILALAAVLAIVGEARAQLFGARTVGQPLARRARAGGREVGSVRGTERFVRGNRQGADFVGADSRDRRDFVGSQLGDSGGSIRSAVTNLQIETGPDANRGPAPSTRSTGGMYDPRLKVNFDFPRRPPQQISAALARRLELSSAVHATRRIEVWLEGETATLRGEVASERERRLAELLVLFEPGISEVRNELTLPARSPPAVEDPPVQGPRRSGPREF